MISRYGLDQVIKFCKSRGALITDAFLFKAGARAPRHPAVGDKDTIKRKFKSKIIYSNNHFTVQYKLEHQY